MLKFFHLLSLIMFSSSFICLSFLGHSSITPYSRLKIMHSASIFFLLLTIFFGVLLVHPKGYFFSTPWIEAALVFCFILLGLLIATFFCYRQASLNSISKSSGLMRMGLGALQFLIMVIVLIVIHDAVTKTTGLL
jgi:uncharacterized membrane protein